MTCAALVRPNPGLIYDLFTGSFRPQVISLALQMGVFTALADGPADAATVASACPTAPSCRRQRAEHMPCGPTSVLERLRPALRAGSAALPFGRGLPYLADVDLRAGKDGAADDD